MRILSLCKCGDSYYVRAKTFNRLCGMKVNCVVREFIHQEKNQIWCTVKGRIIKGNKRKQLDKWLINHKRFIEGTTARTA